jgi:hypothetical protein
MTGGGLDVEEINLTQMLPICINPTPVFPVRALFLHPGPSLIRPSRTHILTVHSKPSNTRRRHPASIRVPNSHSTTTPRRQATHDSISLREIRSSPTSPTDRRPGPDPVCNRAGQTSLPQPEVRKESVGRAGKDRKNPWTRVSLLRSTRKIPLCPPRVCLDIAANSPAGTHTHTPHARYVTGQYDFHVDRFPGPQVPPCP